MEVSKNNIASPKKKKWIGPNRMRLMVLKSVFILLFILVVLRLIQIQIVDSAYYKDLAEKQYKSRISLPASRGLILDRNGNIFASNTKYVHLPLIRRSASRMQQKSRWCFQKYSENPNNIILKRSKLNRSNPNPILSGSNGRSTPIISRN